MPSAESLSHRKLTNSSQSRICCVIHQENNNNNNDKNNVNKHSMVICSGINTDCTSLLHHLKPLLYYVNLIIMAFPAELTNLCRSCSFRFRPSRSESPPILGSWRRHASRWRPDPGSGIPCVRRLRVVSARVPDRWGWSRPLSLVVGQPRPETGDILGT